MEYTIKQLEKEGWNPSYFVPTGDFVETDTFEKPQWWTKLPDDNLYKKFHIELETPDFYITKNEAMSDYQYQIFFKEPKDDISEYGCYIYYTSDESENEKFLGISVPEKYIGTILDCITEDGNKDMKVYSHFKMHQTKKSLSDILTATGLHLSFNISEKGSTDGHIYKDIIFKKMEV